MANTKAESTETILEPPAALVRKLFRTSARALMANRPLREVATPATAPAAVLSKAELDALAKVGLPTKPWVAEVDKDPLVKTIVDYMALIETSLATAAVATMLGVDVSRIRQRIRARSLFGVEYEGEWRLPRFQFEKGRVLPGFATVLAALSADLNPLDVATWLLAPNVDLESDGDTAISPRAWLLRGRAPAVVAELARQL
jgi:hypothetical protein